MKIAFAFALAAALAGCATPRSSAPTISDADVGRLAPEQMRPIDEARQAVATARDELARVKLRQQQSQGEAEHARADQTAASADAQRAAAEGRTANESREPAALQRVQQLQQTAALRKQAAAAHLEWSKRLTEARAAQVAAAQRQVELAEAQLELAKLRTLQASNIPAASKYDVKRFQARVDEVRQAHEKAFSQARDLETRSIVSQRRYDDLNRQLQAFLGGRSG